MGEVLRFLTVFISLITGTHEVELVVKEPIGMVELRLDGEEVARLNRPPWKATIDFGEALKPHSLEAIGRDGAGEVVSHLRQPVNLLSAEPIADLVTSPVSDPKKTPQEPDKTPLVVRLGEGISLPPVAAMAGWFQVSGKPLEVLAVEKGLAEVVVIRPPAAQWYWDQAARYFFEQKLGQRTVRWQPQVLQDRGTFIAAVGEMWPQLLKGLETGAISNENVPGIPSGVWSSASIDHLFGDLWDQWKQSFSLPPETRVRFLSPLAGPVSQVDEPMEVFNASPSRLNRNKVVVDDPDLGLLWMAIEWRPLEFKVRLADAVAVAGMEAYGHARRRAVLVMLAGLSREESLYSPDVVRDYLEHLQVPFKVWAFEVTGEREGEEKNSPGGWQGMTILATPQGSVDAQTAEIQTEDYLAKLEQAIRDLHHTLESQRVVWLAGRHLPQDIEITPQAAGIQRAGSSRVQDSGEATRGDAAP